MRLRQVRMNFQSWIVKIKGQDIKPSFSRLALQSKIYTQDDDEPLSVTDIESIDYTKQETAEIIATLMTAMTIDTNRESRPLVFNYNSPDYPKQLCKNKIWVGKWFQVDENGKEHKIDLAKKIRAYYDAESGRSLADDNKLDSTLPNSFVVIEDKKSNCSLQ